MELEKGVSFSWEQAPKAGSCDGIFPSNLNSPDEAKAGEKHWYWMTFTVTLSTVCNYLGERFYVRRIWGNVSTYVSFPPNPSTCPHCRERMYLQGGCSPQHTPTVIPVMVQWWHLNTHRFPFSATVFPQDPELLELTPSGSVLSGVLSPVSSTDPPWEQTEACQGCRLPSSNYWIYRIGRHRSNLKYSSGQELGIESTGMEERSSFTKINVNSVAQREAVMSQQFL